MDLVNQRMSVFPRSSRNATFCSRKCVLIQTRTCGNARLLQLQCCAEVAVLVLLESRTVFSSNVRLVCSERTVPTGRKQCRVCTLHLVQPPGATCPFVSSGGQGVSRSYKSPLHLRSSSPRGSLPFFLGTRCVSGV